MTVLSPYWPSVSNIDTCIRTEAETLDDAVLLAVHEPGPLLVRTANGASQEAATETDLLNALMRSADDGSAVLVAITGDSGVGKSHMVRWLHAQLQRHADRERLVIVLVPKTASLRQVVERILEPMEGAQYRLLKAELSKAADTLRPEAASQMLATALAIELENKFKEGMQALQVAGSTASRVARDRIELTRILRELLRDSDVYDQWFGAVLQRIVRQTIEGGSESQTGDLRRFIPDDLQVPEHWSPSQGREATTKALQQLMKDDGARRPLAADVLQEALDPALRVVFRFSEALGQRTIEEIVDGIRRSLLVEGKELVLLIEDFAALAGIQQPLLNLMIAESDHQGKRIRAPLRTALAVTDGFLPSRQTILTRAKREWIIPNGAQTEEALVRRLTDLAGRYLNAARWGVTSLQEQFSQIEGSDLYGWVRPFDEPLSVDESDMLRAFGKSSHGHSLFPLSPAAIASLCQRELKSGSGLRFNPRAFINSVLRDTLLQRPLHEIKAFPPARFKDAVLPSGTDLALRSKAMSAEQKLRLAPLLVYWAGNPTDLSSRPEVEKGLFDAFSLPWPFASESSPIPSAPKHPVNAVTPTAAPAPAPVAPQPQLDYIEAWASESIPQRPAKHARDLLASALNDRLDWNSARIRSTGVTSGQIWLPFAPIGNPTTEPKFVAANAVRPLSATLRGGIRALERWNANGKSWDYEKSEDDYGVAQQLLDGMEEQVLTWYIGSAHRQASAATRLLHRQSLLLRLTKVADPTAPRLSEYFGTFAAPAVVSETGESTPAMMVVAAVVRAEAARPEAQRALLDSVGCFQGTGKTLHAIDPQRVKQVWRADLSDEAPQQIKLDYPLARKAAEELLTSRLEALLVRCRTAIESTVPNVKALVGDDADVSLVAPLRQQLSRVQRAGLFPTQICSAAEADRSIELLGTEEAKSVLRHAVSFTPPDSSRTPDVRLAGWTTLDINMLVKVHTALTLLDKVMQGMHRAAAAELEAHGGGDVAAMVMSLQQGLTEVSQGETK